MNIENNKARSLESQRRRSRVKIVIKPRFDCEYLANEIFHRYKVDTLIKNTDLLQQIIAHEAGEISNIEDITEDEIYSVLYYIEKMIK